LIEPGVCYLDRVVRTNPPTIHDCVSNLALGKEIPVDPELAELWDGLSVQSTMAQARRRSRISPMLGRFVAVLRIPTDGSVRYERTRGEGHHTRCGEPAELPALVVSVEPV
jgi:hypothetical protein